MKTPLKTILICVFFTFNLLAQSQKPNIIIIYADDLGYGDVSAYKKGQLQTPNIDRLANGGVRFTNGYASSATCTPSRYAMLTGIYPWKNSKAKILTGDAPLIIDTNLETLPKMLKKANYYTAVIGKWHLGLGNGKLDWNQTITNNTNDVGFDYSYIMAATTDRVPTVYIENRKVLGLQTNDPLLVSYEKNFENEPTAISNPELMTKQKWHHGHNQSVYNGIPRIGFMKGGKSALWVDEDMADVFSNKAVSFIEKNNASKTGNPFFLYYALHQPHVPRVPHPRFVGKSGMGARGDAILEADWCVGEIIKKLESEKILDNTLILFSSDNGAVLNDGYYDNAVEKLGNHTPSGGLRGGKYSLFEGGAKVPFIAYWQGKIKPSVSNALICQIDFMATLAKLVGTATPANDSQEFLNVLLGKSNKGRTDLILEASGKLAYRQGNYAFIPPYKGKPVHVDVNIELGISPNFQVYNLYLDPAQIKDLSKLEPKKLEELKKGMLKIAGNAFQINQTELELK